MSGGWIGVDLDGTLAQYGGWQGVDHIGAPIPEMVQRVKDWRAKNIEVRIFTARVWPVMRIDNSDPSENLAIVGAIQNWCKEHIGEILPITCMKDFGMVELWDDRAVRVVFNTGRRCCEEQL